MTMDIDGEKMELDSDNRPYLTLDGGIKVVGLTGPQGMNEQTRTAYFSTDMLVEWAKAVREVYDDEHTVEVLLTPEAPMMARRKDAQTGEYGVSIAPRLTEVQE